MKKYLLIIVSIVVLILCLIMYKLSSNTNDIGNIAWSENNNNYKIYIKENGKFIPYLVVDKNYNNSKDTLVIRENILGGENYSVEYNGSIYQNKVYDKSLLMNQYYNYDETDVDNFLTTTFINYFDKDFINLLNDTEINIDNVFNINEDKYTIKRKFFILSIGELGFENIANKSDNNVIQYFKTNGLITKNDSNENVNYWTRSYSYGLGGYFAIG